MTRVFSSFQRASCAAREGTSTSAKPSARQNPPTDATVFLPNFIGDLCPFRRLGSVRLRCILLGSGNYSQCVAATRPVKRCRRSARCLGRHPESAAADEGSLWFALRSCEKRDSSCARKDGGLRMTRQSHSPQALRIFCGAPLDIAAKTRMLTPGREWSSPEPPGSGVSVSGPVSGPVPKLRDSGRRARGFLFFCRKCRGGCRSSRRGGLGAVSPPSF